MNSSGEMTRLTAIAEPGAGLLTTVQAEHTEFLGSLEGVARAEGELFRGLAAAATAVVNLDEALVVQQAQETRARWLTFGRSASAEVQLVSTRPLGGAGQEVELRVDGRTHTVPLAFLGPHNALHAAGAWALARALGFGAETCVQGLARARPVARRLNVLQAPGGLTVLDDCYNANPASMAAALQTARELAGRGRVVAVLGDMLELGSGEAEEHARLARLAARLAEVRAFLGPRNLAAAGSGEEGAAARFVDADALWAWLFPRLAAGDVVLVKGSRGMRMERIVERLTGTPAPAAH
jgi:UDP-N-acetylmuramoyl-tripeptide--D-alanyl-D-alanine ligase